MVGATTAAVNALVEHCRNDPDLSNELIHSPSGIDVVNCTKESDIYQARMKDGLVRRLRFKKIREFDLAWVDADILLVDESASDANVAEIIPSDGVAADTLPVLAPPLHPVDHSTVFVNEPRLSDVCPLVSKSYSMRFPGEVFIISACS